MHNNVIILHCCAWVTMMNIIFRHNTCNQATYIRFYFSEWKRKVWWVKRNAHKDKTINFNTHVSSKFRLTHHSPSAHNLSYIWHYGFETSHTTSTRWKLHLSCRKILHCFIAQNIFTTPPILFQTPYMMSWENLVIFNRRDAMTNN